MKLGQYIEENGLTLNELAGRCGTSASTILRVKDAEVAPSKRVARALWAATQGQVTPNDLYGLYCTRPCIGNTATERDSVLKDRKTK